MDPELDFGVIKTPDKEPKAQKEVRRKTMAKQTTYTGMLGDWQGLLELLAANSAEIPQVEPYRTKLGALLAQALEVTQRQAGLKARSRRCRSSSARSPRMDSGWRPRCGS